MRKDITTLNVNVGRDFDPDIVTDLIAVEKGMPCPECETPAQQHARH